VENEFELCRDGCVRPERRRFDKNKEREQRIKMSSIIARMMLVPFWHKFLTDYNRVFRRAADDTSLVPYVEKSFLPWVDKMLTDPNADPVQLLDLFLDSFGWAEKRLKERDLSLFAESKAKIVHMLMINAIWKPTLDAEAKQIIWDHLIGAYLIAEIKVRVPPRAVQQIENLMSRHFKRMAEEVENKDISLDKDRFKQDAHSVYDSFDEKDLQQLMSYMMEFLTSDATPIYKLIPEYWHGPLKMLIRRCKTEGGRMQIFNQMMPMFDGFKTKLGVSDEVTDILSDPRLQQLAVEGEEEREQRKLIVGKLLNIITEAIARNCHLIRDVAKNPTETITTFLAGTVFPSIISISGTLGETSRQQQDQHEAMQRQKLHERLAWDDDEREDEVEIAD